ncbi:MAG: hypothetical protein HXY22_04155 [Alphaproteobacteria bacterium]|nr:hypothetical protein [Alphaproteobacteria bacterium]
MRAAWTIGLGAAGGLLLFAIGTAWACDEEGPFAIAPVDRIDVIEARWSATEKGTIDLTIAGTTATPGWVNGFLEIDTFHPGVDHELTIRFLAFPPELASTEESSAIAISEKSLPIPEGAERIRITGALNTLTVDLPDRPEGAI